MNACDATVGLLVARCGSHIGGTICEVFPLSPRVRVAWGLGQKVRHTLVPVKSLEVVDRATLKARVQQENAKLAGATAHYKYCAAHHRRLNGDGTCCACAAFPQSVYTLGDRTPRPFDGPER